jgi:pyruvate kinase
VRITETPPRGGRLRAEKGINLPETDLHISALTEKDLGCLDWVAAHADVVGMSFVQRPADVLQLHAELDRRGRPDLGIVLKIETAKGFQRLPELLFAGLRSPPLGVMVARGDLAVEVGYARLAEVQEEILWVCEAAHVPVIWATQVLDSMAKSGVPSRAEVTDAAMGVRAECVMLNKGPFIVETARFLGGVLERMQEHHVKKRSMLRALRVAGAAQPRQ